MSGEFHYSHLDAGGSVLSRVHCQAQKTLGIIDRPIEPQTIAHFIEFAVGTTDLPNGKKTSLELLTKSEATDLLESSPDTDGDPQSIIERVLERVGSLEDGGRLSTVGKNIHAVKSRAWAGMVPLSEQRWKEKGLDKPENFDIAVQHLTAVIAAFEYLNTPIIMENLRDTFNLISAHWGELDAMIHAQDSSRRGVSTRKLWTEFMTAQFEMMTERAHRWVLVHANALRVPLHQQVLAHRPETLQHYDRTQWHLTDRLHTLAEIVALADFTILLPMDGYAGDIPWRRLPQLPFFIPAELRSTELGERGKAYSERLKVLSRRAQAESAIERIQRADGTYRTADPAAIARTTVLQIECQNQVRREVRGEPVEPIPREPWIVRDIARMERPGNEKKAIGFVVYRLTYGQSEEEWAAFRKKLDEHMSDWGRGQTGSSALKPYQKLHWRDGRELGIAEGDIAAARKHYASHYDDPLPLKLVDSPNSTFLAIESASYASYTGNTYTAATDLVLPGDHTGFILAVDGDYDEKEGAHRPDETPGYQGHMRMLGSLIWGELYAMLSYQSAILEDLWPLATEHPNQVYVGPTVPLEIKGWRIQNGMRGMLMRTVSEYAKAKVDGRPWPTTSSATTPTPTPTPASASASASAPETAQPTQPSSPTAPPPETTPDPSRTAAARQNDIRTWISFQYTRWLRSRGQQREAIMAEELIRVPPGQIPDIDTVHRRMVLEGVLDEDELRDAIQRWQNEGHGDGDRDGDGNGEAPDV